MIVTHQTMLTWHEASNPPDADIEILVAARDGVVVGYFDDEQGEFCNSFGAPIPCKYWADMPEGPA